MIVSGIIFFIFYVFVLFLFFHVALDSREWDCQSINQTITVPSLAVPWLGVVAMPCLILLVGLGDFCSAEVTAWAVGVSPLLPGILVWHIFECRPLSCLAWLFFYVNIENIPI